jgi:hypothetical protein
MEVAAMQNPGVIQSIIARKLIRAMEKTVELIEKCEESNLLRLDGKAFTRERKLGPRRILDMLLLRIYHSLQLCIESYFEKLGEPGVTKQAFSKARKHLNPDYVRQFADATSEIAAKDEGKITYNGMPLVAIDGSDIALENTPELKQEFGCSGSKKNAATALGSIAFDPFNHAIYDCRIDRYGTDERTLAKAHVKRLLELNMGGSLLLFDRWYPSAEFVSFLYENGFHFVMRVRDKFNVEADAIETQGWIQLTHDGREYPVRVLKAALPTGEVETLITSLNQKQLPISKAGGLYFERWKVETAYDLLKSKLELENFSGKTKVSVLQDFYATIYMANIISFAAEEADALIAQKDEGKKLKYKRKANRNRCVSKFRERFIRILLSDPGNYGRLLDDLIADVAKYPIPVVPGRSPLRKTPRKKRFFQSRRSVV